MKITKVLETSPLPTIGGIINAMSFLPGQNYILYAGSSAYAIAKEVINHRDNVFSKKLYDYILVEKMEADDIYGRIQWYLFNKNGYVYSKGDGTYNPGDNNLLNKLEE